MSPGNPRISAHATGDELTTLNGAVVAGNASGTIFKGSFELNPRVVNAVGDKATVSDCYVDRTGQYKVSTGERIDKEDLSPVGVVVTLQLVGEVWKVASIDHRNSACD